jgi:hypothetical protein
MRLALSPAIGHHGRGRRGIVAGPLEARLARAPILRFTTWRASRGSRTSLHCTSLPPSNGAHTTFPSTPTCEKPSSSYSACQAKEGDRLSRTGPQPRLPSLPHLTFELEEVILAPSAPLACSKAPEVLGLRDGLRGELTHPPPADQTGTDQQRPPAGPERAHAS